MPNNSKDDGSDTTNPLPDVFQDTSDPSTEATHCPVSFAIASTPVISLNVTPSHPIVHKDEQDRPHLFFPFYVKSNIIPPADGSSSLHFAVDTDGTPHEARSMEQTGQTGQIGIENSYSGDFLRISSAPLDTESPLLTSPSEQGYVCLLIFCLALPHATLYDVSISLSTLLSISFYFFFSYYFFLSSCLNFFTDGELRNGFVIFRDCIIISVHPRFTPLVLLSSIFRLFCPRRSMFLLKLRNDLVTHPKMDFRKKRFVARPTIFRSPVEHIRVIFCLSMRG